MRTNFPNKAYGENDEKSLKELGLAPSCALVIALVWVNIIKYNE